MFLQRVLFNLKKYILSYGRLDLSLIICLPLFMLFAIETFSRGDLLCTFSWLANYPKQFLITYLLLFGIINFFYILQRKAYIAFGFLLISFFSIVSIINRQKLILRGEPLLPWDIILGKEALAIFEKVYDIKQIILVFIISAVLLIPFILKKYIPEENYIWRRKLAVPILSLVVLLSFNTKAISLEKTFSLQMINWSQKINYEENGLLLGFILNTNNLMVDKMDEYEEEIIGLIVNKTTPAAYAVDAGFQPNIIFFMSEAFWDPTLMKEVSFNKDPLPNFHLLQKEQTSGLLLSPVFGGGTVNTEFEVLTGFSTQFLPQGVVSYVKYVHKPLETLPAVLKKQGYEATAIHTYDNWFYNRNTVYQKLDFDRFISREFFDKPEYYGQYIRDTELSGRILEEIKKTDKPDFIFAVSMQAHGPYSAEENQDSLIKINGDLKPESKAILENYSQILSDVDQSLKLLIEGLEKINEPSIVIFFGDHLPLLGNSFDVYREANFFQDEIYYQDYLNMYSVPFIVWDNFSCRKEKLRLSANFLGPYVLERVQKSGSLMTDFLQTLMHNGSSVVISEQHIPQEEISGKEISEYQLLQYDLLFGNEYAYGLKPDHRPQSNSSYVLGDAQTLIGNTLLTDESVIEIQGESFLPGHEVYVNGQAVPASFDNQTELTAVLPESLKAVSGTLDIQVKLRDSRGKVISESNTFKLEVL